MNRPILTTLVQVIVLAVFATGMRWLSVDWPPVVLVLVMGVIFVATGLLVQVAVRRADAGRGPKGASRHHGHDRA